MIKKQPVFDLSSCLSCSICVQACPFSCLELSLPGKQGKYKNMFPQRVRETCSGCGLCANACPMGCIEMKEPADEG